MVEEYQITGSTQTHARTLTWGRDLGGSPSLQAAGGVGGLLMVEKITGSTTTAYHFHYDGNGNVTEITNLNGSSAARYRYDAFGNTLVGTGPYAAQNRYRFSTKPLDHEVAGAPLSYYGYRYYDPETGRWPSRDQIEEEGGVNLYGFVANDGVNRVDKLGMEEVETNSSRMSSPLAIISFENHYFLKVDGLTFGFWPAGGKKKLMSMLPFMWVKGEVVSPDWIGSGEEKVIKLDDCDYEIEKFNKCMKDSAKAGPSGRYNLIFNNCWHWREGVISKCMEKAKKK